jgi:alanine-glyoxylate transaminase/serine-glyoxylate transaminase/serine-pyruvate transaminase
VVSQTSSEAILHVDPIFQEAITHMGAGPCPGHPRVLQALSLPPVSHLNNHFGDLCLDVREKLKYIFQTKNNFTVPIQASASGVLEAVLTSLIEPSDSILICQNGFYGERMAEISRRLGANVIVVEHSWDEALNLERIKTALKNNPQIKIAGFVHAETSANIVNDPLKLKEIFKEHDCIVVVDAVGTIINQPVLVDEWGWDVVYTNAQKCIAAPAGLSPLTMSDRAIHKIRSRKTSPYSWLFDLNYIIDLWYQKTSVTRPFHHTPAVNLMYGLNEALCMIEEIGLENLWSRYQILGSILKNGLEAIGLKEYYKIPRDSQIVNMTCYGIPEGIPDEQFREILLRKFRLAISTGMGETFKKVWRVSAMGHIYLKDVLMCLSAVEITMSYFGAHKKPLGTALEAVHHEILRATDNLPLREEGFTPERIFV